MKAKTSQDCNSKLKHRSQTAESAWNQHSIKKETKQTFVTWFRRRENIWSRCMKSTKVMKLLFSNRVDSTKGSHSTGLQRIIRLRKNHRFRMNQTYWQENLSQIIITLLQLLFRLHYQRAMIFSTQITKLTKPQRECKNLQQSSRIKQGKEYGREIWKMKSQDPDFTKINNLKNNK